MDKSKKPDFALLIGKKLDAKDKGSEGDEPVESMSPDESDAGDGEQGQMEDSAVADLLAAIGSKSVPATKQALKDFIDLCEQSEPSEAEPAAEA